MKVELIESGTLSEVEILLDALVEIDSLPAVVGTQSVYAQLQKVRRIAAQALLEYAALGGWKP